MTSLTVFLAAFSLFVFGAGVVHEFALVFMIGIATGTASSIFIANPVFCWWHKGDRNHVEARDFAPKYDVGQFDPRRVVRWGAEGSANVAVGVGFQFMACDLGASLRLWLVYPL